MTNYLKRLFFVIGLVCVPCRLFAQEIAREIAPAAPTAPASVETAPAANNVPVLLLPDSELVGNEPLPPEKPQPENSSPTVIKTLDGDIAIESLHQIDPEIIGTLDPTSGDLGFDLWHGTDRLKIHALIAALPARIKSASLRRLARRLLLTTADMQPVPTNTPSGPSLTQLRVRQLMAMGLLDDAIELMTLAEQSGLGDSLREEQVEAHLYLNNYSDLCKQVALADDRLDESYWQKLLVFCQTLAGNQAGAELGNMLLTDQGDTDEAYFILIEKLLHDAPGELANLENPNALHLALAQLSETALPASVLKSDNPSILRATAANRATDMAIRLEAAEQAALRGAIAGESLADIYKAVVFTKEELSNPISVASLKNTPASRALLYQAADQETIPEARALIVQKALELAQQAEIYPLSIAVHQKHILQSEASIDIWWFAGDAARALYAAGRPLPAQAWLGHLHTRSLRDPEARIEMVDFWPLANMSAKGLLRKIDDQDRLDWVESQIVRAEDERQARAHIATAYILLEALDQKIPLQGWTALALMGGTDHARLPNPAVSHMMHKASAAGRRGETLAWAIILLGELGTSHAGIATTADAMTALRALGFQKEARAIALEAAIARGL